MMSWLHLWHRAAEAGSVLQIDHWPRPAAAVQQSTMPGALQELGTTTWLLVGQLRLVCERSCCAALPVWLAVETYS